MSPKKLRFDEIVPLIRSILAHPTGSIEDVLNPDRIPWEPKHPFFQPTNQTYHALILSKLIALRMDRKAKEDYKQVIAYIKHNLPSYNPVIGEPSQFVGNTLYLSGLQDQDPIERRRYMLAMTHEGTGYTYPNWLAQHPRWRSEMESLPPRFMAHSYLTEYSAIKKPLFESNKSKDPKLLTEHLPFTVSRYSFPFALNEVLRDNIELYDSILMLEPEVYPKGRDPIFATIPSRNFEQHYQVGKEGSLYTNLGYQIASGMRVYSIQWRRASGRYQPRDNPRALLFCYPEERPTQLIHDLYDDYVEITSDQFLTTRGLEALTFIFNQTEATDYDLTPSNGIQLFYVLQDLRIEDLTLNVYREVYKDLPLTAAQSLPALKFLIEERELRERTVVPIDEIPTFSPIPELKSSKYIPVSAEGSRVLMRKKKAKVTAYRLMEHENYFIHETA